MRAFAALQRLARRGADRSRHWLHPGAAVDSITDPCLPFGAHVDAVVRPDDHSLFAVGWIWDARHQVERASLLLGARRLGPLPGLRIERPDVRQRYAAEPHRDAAVPAPGFAAFLQLDRAVALDAPVRLELRLRDGRELRLRTPAAITCPFAARARLLAAFQDLAGDEAPMRELQHALGRTLGRCAEARRVAADWTIGAPPRSPEVSIVVPLFRELDLLECQLAEFARDDDLLRRAELIYVLDSPEQTEWLRRSSRHLWELYRVPARFVALQHNAGFAGATNTGAQCAQAPFLLLLNSDVLPAAPGWLGAMLRAWRRHRDPGALAPRLLFEDGSLQHAGIYWAPEPVRLRPGPRPVDRELWVNHLYHKGCPGDLPAAQVAREVPAVAAACMLTTAALFHALDGLDESYVQGDCEDTDFCLRLAARGHAIRYEPAIALYHLEGASYPAGLRQPSSMFNLWQQDQRWRAAMIARMQRCR